MIGLALLLPAPISLISPQLAASAFGVPAGTVESQAYLLATSVRDVALGVWLLSMITLRADRRLLAVSVWSISLVAAGDALNVAVYTQLQNMLSLAPHVGGLLVLGGLGWYLWNRPQTKV